MGVASAARPGATVADSFSADDRAWMARALTAARAAGAIDEVPVGAVVVRDGVELGAGHNACITRHDPSAHAEIEALRAAAAQCGNYRLPGATLYVTLEPCAMCAGAIVQARIERVVFGTTDPRAGAAGSVMNVLQHSALNHRARIDAGLEQAACAQLLLDFFAARRRAGA